MLHNVTTWAESARTWAAYLPRRLGGGLPRARTGNPCTPGALGVGRTL